jgi:hypothetical protein
MLSTPEMATGLRSCGALGTSLPSWLNQSWVPAPDDENDSLASEPSFPGVLAELTAPTVMASVEKWWP